MSDKVEPCLNTRFLAIFVVALFLLVPSIASAATIGRPPAQNYTGLVGYWTFDGPDMVGGTVMDRSGRGNSGDMENMASSTAYVKGKVGQAIQLDGVDDDIRIAENNVLDMTGNFTLALWVKPTRVDLLDNIYIKSGSGGIQFGLGGFSNNVGYFICAAGVNCAFDSKGSYNLGVWNSVAVTRNGNDWTLYNDGVAVYTVNDATAISDTSGMLFIGSESGSIRFFNGALDEIRMYNRALSSAEIARLHNAGASRINASSAHSAITAGIAGYWTFDGPDMVGGTVADRSGRGYQGDMENMATSTAYVKGKIGQALNFDGVNDHVILPSDVYDADQQGSITSWFRLKSKNLDSASGVIFGLGNAIDTNRAFSFGTWGVSASDTRLMVCSSVSSPDECVYGSTNLSPGVWYHAAVVSNGSSWSLFINGVSETVNVLAGGNFGAWFGDNADGNVDRYTIGNLRQSGGDTGFFNGAIDAVNYYSRPLSSSEVKDLYTQVGSEMNTSSAGPSILNGSTGLSGHWTFDGPDMVGGTVMDRSGRGNHGDMENTSTSTVYIKGKIGQALNFDGQNDFVSIPNGVYTTAHPGYSISMWVKGPHISVREEVYTEINTNQACNICIDNSDSSNRVRVFITGTVTLNQTSAAVAFDNSWHHIVWTDNAGAGKLYIDGVQDSSDFSYTPGTPVALLRSRIGTINQFGTDESFFKGAIDDVRTYNRVLSADEVKRLYNSGK